MLKAHNHIIEGKHKPILLDFGYQPNGVKKPIIIFAHGFKGFKDWGHFNKVMEYFIDKGFVFVKFNFSHNGGTLKQPIDFPDLETFGNNNYSKEVDDLKTVVDWAINNQAMHDKEVDRDEIYLVGHSRGGGISILEASKDSRVKKLATWAAVSDFEKRLPNELEDWKKNGVIYIANARTHQEMPMYYQFAEDLLSNKDQLNIERAERSLKIPHLIIHGTNDEAVNVNEAKELKEWNESAELFLIEGAGHTFGAQHPFLDKELPFAVQKVLQKTSEFFKN